jgi:hypothetical protein
MKRNKTTFKIKRVIHLSCGKPFYEAENSERDVCPNCQKRIGLESEGSIDITITHTKDVYIDPMTANLSY